MNLIDTDILPLKLKLVTWLGIFQVQQPSSVSTLGVWVQNVFQLSDTWIFYLKEMVSAALPLAGNVQQQPSASGLDLASVRCRTALVSDLRLPAVYDTPPSSLITSVQVMKRRNAGAPLGLEPDGELFAGNHKVFLFIDLRATDGRTGPIRGLFKASRYSTDLSGSR